MNHLGRHTSARRRNRRGILSTGWIDVYLEPLERRIMMTDVTSVLALGGRAMSMAVTDSRPSRGLARPTVVERLAHVIPPPLAARGTTFSAVAGHSFDGKIATFVGVDTDQLARYTANVMWGDGTY